jgi:hypothetical protein
MWKDKEIANEVPATEPVRGNIAGYREAVQEFSDRAAEFLKCLPLLSSTRDAYERAMSISAEVRKVLDTGDETLRRMMGQIEDAVHGQLGSRPEKKKPEIVKMESSKSEEAAASPKALP